MRTIAADPNLVAYCGLYCGACARRIREIGIEAYAQEMTAKQAQTISQ